MVSFPPKYVAAAVLLTPPFYSRFSSPSQFSMHLAAKFLEDQDFVKQLLDKSHRVLFKIRLLTEKLLDEAGIRYEKKG